MLFSSLEFLYLFLPLALALYVATPRALRNLTLLAVSLVFYGVGEPAYLWLMVATVTVDYALGLAIAKRPHRARLLLWLAVALHLLLLALFKYYALVARLLPFLPPWSPRLPVGISFYVFQALSYVIDVSRGAVAPQKSLVRFGTYVIAMSSHNTPS